MPRNTWLIASVSALDITRSRRAARSQIVEQEKGHMRTDDFRPSDNVEDDREASASRGGMPGGAGGLGIGTVIIIGLVSCSFCIVPAVLLNGAKILSGGATTHQSDQAPATQAGTPQDATGR